MFPLLILVLLGGSSLVSVTDITVEISQVRETTLRWTLTNTGEDKLTIRRWELPLDPLSGGQGFVLRGDHGILAYQGAHVKRSAPNADSWVTVEPSDSLTINFDLRDAFSLRGSLQVSYESRVFVQGQDAPLLVKSNTLTLSVTTLSFFIPPPMRENIFRDVDTVPIVGSTTGARQYFISCNDKQKSQVPQALRSAASATKAKSTSSTWTSFHTKWFGRYSSNLKVVNSHYYAISDAMSSRDSSFDCKPPKCSDSSTFAYVYPSDAAHTMHLCGGYWTASASWCWTHAQA